MMDGADVSLAVADNCTAEAVGFADMVVMDSTKNAVQITKSVAKKVHRVAMENIVFSVLVKAVILICDVLLSKELPMWFAIFGDIGICLLAVANSARVIKFKKR